MKKGFTLIELLAVIVILAIIALIATPIILGVVENARKSAAGSSALGYIDAVEKEIALGGFDATTYPVGYIDILTSEYYQDIEVQGEKPSKGRLTVTENYLITSAVLCVNNYKVELTGHKIKKITKNACDEIKKRKIVEFGKDNSRAAKPNLKGDLIPVAYDGENWVESDGTQGHWYNYNEKKWANAVILTEDGEVEDDGTIKEEDIAAFFVWIPKYRYKIWNLDAITINEKPKDETRLIEIEFNTTNTQNIDGRECIATNKSGDVGKCNVDEWMTHPAFTSFEVDGFWVGKFELTGTVDNISVRPNSSPLVTQNIKTFFEVTYNYDKSEGRILDSHMMKNTEWGAVAYLSQSKYGIDGEVGINNYIIGDSDGEYMTGCGAAPASGAVNICNSYNTDEGMKASTTGNIYGIYDMSGGRWESMSGYIENANYGKGIFDEDQISQYDAKYFDVYIYNFEIPWNDITFRILGDATAELGPKYFDPPLSVFGWYGDYFGTPGDKNNSSWSVRGGRATNGGLAGIFVCDWTAPDYAYSTSRLVLAPK